MTDAPIPVDDEHRVRALHALDILDTPAERAYDKIVAFAAEEFDLPIALVSLVDRDRQWFKAKLGLEVTETPRGVSFCGHAIFGTEILVVENALDDERFADNPLVTGAPGIRFYAGAPLHLPSGEAIGTLCVIGTEPRQFTPADRAMLSTLRELVVEQFACM